MTSNLLSPELGEKNDAKLKSNQKIASETGRAIKNLTANGSTNLTYEKIKNWFSEAGLELNDPIFSNILGNYRDNPQQPISVREFESVYHLHGDIFSRLANRCLAVPNFKAFCMEWSRIFFESQKNRGGKVADYIPQLAKVDAELFSAGFCSVDGQRFVLGEREKEFCVQSCGKPITYSIAVEDMGLEKVHEHVGREPSGRGFNDFVFDYRGLPHNPMINSGAIMCASMIKPEQELASRFEHILDYWRELAGGGRIGYDNPTYLSEKSSADRNYALGHFMRENKAFPKGIDLHQVIDLYFQICSISMNAETMSIVAATLANGGICPRTGHRVLKPQTVRGCLSLMHSCGLYDYSGEFAFKIGMPAKSGVSGVMMLIVPNVMGICLWSPRLDRLGNSVRGLEFSSRLQDTFHFHLFDQLIPGLSHDMAIQGKTGKSRADLMQITDLCYAAADGDLDYVKRLVAKGIDCSVGDYDGRTPLHLAAAEGHLEVCSYLIKSGAKVGVVDRFGMTPKDEAKRGQNKEVQEFFAQLP